MGGGARAPSGQLLYVGPGSPLLQVHPWKITAEMAIANSLEGGLQ